MAIIEVDASKAPRFLHYRIGRNGPSAEDLDAMRRLVRERGYMTAETRLLVDIRALEGMPSMEETQHAMSPGDVRVLPAAVGLLTQAGLQAELARSLLSMITGEIETAHFTNPDEAEAWWLREFAG